MDNLYRNARRATAGKTVLDMLAIVFLACSLAFWGVLHWQVLVQPAGAALPQIIIAGVMTLIYSLALPVLLSALVPSTPAAQLLQRTKWGTIGFWVIIPSVVLLGWYAYNLMYAWFASQPTIADAGMERQYTISGLIAFVVIVALAWTQASPDRWLREIQQAHEVKKLQVQQQGELAIIKARLLWAEQKAAISYAKLLPVEQQEIRDTLRGLLMGIADTQRSIARTMGISAEIERSIMDDDEIAESMEYVAQQLEQPAKLIDYELTSFDDRNRESHVETIEQRTPAHVDTRAGPSKTRVAPDATRRHMTTPDDAYARAAADAFGRKPWTVKQLCVELEIGETKAREMRDDWLHRGIIDQTNLGRWHFTESEA